MVEITSLGHWKQRKPKPLTNNCFLRRHVWCRKLLNMHSLDFSQILTLKFNDKHIKWRKMQHDRLWRVTSRSCVSYYRHCIRQILDVWHGIKNVNPRTSRWHILPCLVSLCMQDSYSQSLRQLRHVTYPLLYPNPKCSHNYSKTVHPVLSNSMDGLYPPSRHPERIYPIVCTPL